MSGTYLDCIFGTDNQHRKADIIFVHGLGGDSRGTWHPQGKRDDNNFWPRWLGEDFTEYGIWSVNYQGEPTSWRGHSMPLLKRATNVIDLLDQNGLGKKPIIFITHSMGGLVVKQSLLNAIYSDEQSWKKIVEQTKGIVYLSTPHSGSNIANWFKYIGGILGATISISELEKNKPDLINLNRQYCAHEKLSKIPVLVYCETKKLKINWALKVIVVDEQSADPNRDIPGRGIEQIKVVPIDEDHISISKPNAKSHTIYTGVKQFIGKCLSDDGEENHNEANSNINLTRFEKTILLRDQLLQCRSMQNPFQRRQIINALPAEIANGVIAEGDNSSVAFDLITKCLDVQDGLSSLLKATEMLHERGTLQMNELWQKARQLFPEEFS